MKRKSDDIDLSAATGSAGDSGIRLVPQRHELPGMAAVRLQPIIELTDAGAVNRVVISPLQRTPSPFGNRMGDHTVAWQTVVDALHAQLHALPVADAIDLLGKRQEAAQAWMADPASSGMSLLLGLEDGLDRAPRLEDAACQVRDRLAAARDQLGRATGAARPAALRQAVLELELAAAQHLAFLNYLPYATVEAASARGSRGSGEGSHRAAVLDLEQVAVLKEDKGVVSVGGPLPAFDAAALRSELWGLFAFDAALRAAEVDRALDVNLTTTLDTVYNALDDLSDRFFTEAVKHEQARTADITMAQTIEDEARKLDRPGTYEALGEAAQAIRDGATALRDVNGQTLVSKRRRIDEELDDVAEAMTTAQYAVSELQAAAGTAIDDAAAVLAPLLYHHQESVAAAYPGTVLASGFLKPDAAGAAVARLEAEVQAQYPELAKYPTLATLLTAVRTQHAALGAGPAVARRNGWVANAAADRLVIRYDPGKRPAGPTLTVNGRPPAPRGVSGMGSHTTAWLVETKAVDALVTKAADDAAALAALRSAVLADLQSGVMKLDVWLPARQIEAGQMSDVFDTALQVLQATDVARAAAAYLTFRNVLPYATVDAGSRSGHGERSGSKAEDLFDRASLVEETGLLADALRTSDGRRAAALAAGAERSRLDEDGAARWGVDADLRAAVAACAARMTAQKKLLGVAVKKTGASQPPAVVDPAKVAAAIVDVRWKEHTEVCRDAGVG